ncbi:MULTISPECIES: ATP-binding cassette domain-containing protein [unclassified Rhodococcus (in: high G+C Gram-positive bacteria)]|uniref:ABC-F family ATP-binding cassette domain-containing protein n=1 Tax=unclassified Rhodococcus (in: high G+C Gram-positive bacteria) TaxID=192944 RepID=UPI0011EF001E|nr:MULTISPECIES: ATP-binding cassette domain-containing protein [unclassified Rhodococcus (in: high G+C Gram-positive bacteria)]KAA0924536.1 ABC-F family ATP-binding cassette domain-containing protein [Rhodococcus sp. ANT_H53B]MDI9926072.1 ATP-binding cassette domain-containing protein [Rhodococcus sp. IEGM 1341]
MPQSSSLSVSNLSFSWPDGDPVFDALSAIFPSGTTGLIGSNGAGKSTLLKLLAGELTPQRGSISTPGVLGHLRQDVALDPDLPVDRVLSIESVRKALHRIESGSSTEDDFTIVGSAWDVEERALALLGKLGLGSIVGSAGDLDRRVGTLSGGETTLLALTAQLLAQPDVLLLDEPTNNLDQVARERLYTAVDGYPGVLIVCTHDLELLERVDTIAEVRAERSGVSRLRMFGGNYQHYRSIVDAEQQAARATIRDAKNDVRKQERELIDTRIKLDRRLRFGKKMEEHKRVPPILAGRRKRAAQESAGKLHGTHSDRVDDARSSLSAAEDLLRDDREIRVDLPATKVHAGQVVLDHQELRVVGPERIALIGPNGSGKTTLLRALDATGAEVPWKYVPQRLDVFDESRTVAENIADVAPQATAEQIRGQLARFLFRGSDADAVVATLSGGERLRAALARILLAEPAPKLLILDEPTNNLDITSRQHLIDALDTFEGALIIASHDRPFLDAIGPTRTVDLTPTVESPESAEEAPARRESM